MNLRRPPHKQTVPDVPRVESALGRSSHLGSLLYRIELSQRCLEAVKPVLPQALASYVKAGPVDEEGWTLLVANTAISAKLRQLQPRLMEALARQGLKINAIRLRVQAR
jgi:hypothetical protein